MSEQVPYSRRNLDLRAAEYYASIRKPENDWKSITDLSPQLAEFGHREQADASASAYQLLEQIDYNYLRKWGHYSLLLSLRSKLASKLLDPASRTENIVNMARIYCILGEIKKAEELLEEVTPILHNSEDLEISLEFFDYLGLVYLDLARFNDAIRLYTQAISTAGMNHDDWTCVYLGRLGVAYRCIGQVEKAIQCQKGALAIARRLNDLGREGVELGGLGTSYRDIGLFDEAIELYKRALTIAREVGDRRRESIWLGFLSIVYRYRGQIQNVLDYYDQAIKISHEIGDLRHENIWVDNLAFAYYAFGDFQKALTLHRQSLIVDRATGDPRSTSYALIGLGRTLLALNEPSEARNYCEEAVDLNVPETSFQAATVLGIALLHFNREMARDVFSDAIARSRMLLDLTPEIFEPHYVLAVAEVGKAVCDSNWENRHTEITQMLIARFRSAVRNCSAPGVVMNAIRDLELIQSSGVLAIDDILAFLRGVLVTTDALT